MPANDRQNKNKFYLAVIIGAIVIIAAWILNIKNTLPREIPINNNLSPSGLGSQWNQMIADINQLIDGADQQSLLFSPTPTSTAFYLQNPAQIKSAELDKLIKKIKLSTSTAELDKSAKNPASTSLEKIIK